MELQVEVFARRRIRIDDLDRHERQVVDLTHNARQLPIRNETRVDEHFGKGAMAVLGDVQSLFDLLGVAETAFDERRGQSGMFKPLTVLHAGWCIDPQRGLAAEQSAENFSAAVCIHGR